MKIDLDRPLRKVCSESERAVEPQATVEMVRERARRIGVELDITTWEHGGVFWTSRMAVSFRDRLPRRLRGFRLAGKGPSERQCRASCAMEMVERYSLYSYIDRHRGEHECLDLRTGETRKLGRLHDLGDTKCVSAGNYYEDAVLHSLHELIETRLGRSCLFKPFKLVDLDSLFPELPEWVRRTMVVIKTPSNKPQLHHFTALKYPANGQFDERFTSRIIRTEEHLFWAPGHRPKNHHSPNSGGAAGLNPKLCAFRAMNEVFQGDSRSVGTGQRRDGTPLIDTADASELVDYETDSITADIRLILDVLGEEVFVGAIDVTDPDLGVPVVRLVSDYDPNTSLASRETMSLFFEL